MDDDPLVSELRKLATTEYPVCQEARLLLEMAVDAQNGKAMDLTRLTDRREIENCEASPPPPAPVSVWPPAPGDI